MGNMQNHVLQDNQTTKRMLPYIRQYVVIAIYEILDSYGAEYEKADDSMIASEISVYGNKSRFAISVKKNGIAEGYAAEQN